MATARVKMPGGNWTFVFWWCLMLLSSAGDELGYSNSVAPNSTAARKYVHYCKSISFVKLNKKNKKIHYTQKN